MNFNLDSLMKKVMGQKGTAQSTANTQAKYEKLQSRVEIPQLVYPAGLLNPNRGLGHFILFNFNYISGTQFAGRTGNVENNNIAQSPYKQPVVYDRKSNSLRSSMYTTHKRSKESIAIYMPAKLTTSYGSDWQTTELGMVGKVIQAAKNYDNLDMADVGNMIREEGIKMTAGAIQALTPLNVKDAAELMTGSMSNPFVEVLFKGVNNRDFQMSFNFTPRNNEEANTVAEIIRRFQFHMMPEYKYNQDESSYMLHPSTVDVTFMKIDENGNAVRNTWLHRMSTCAISNVSVDETPEGTYDVHHDDSPVTRSMDISLIELEQLHKGRFLSADDKF